MDLQLPLGIVEYYAGISNIFLRWTIELLGFDPSMESGLEKILETIPKNKRYYITIDIDAFDPSIAAGTGTPSHGGFYYYEILELLDPIIKQGEVIGMDLVEVAPDYDLSFSTSTLAAQLLMNAIGRILYYKNL